jgi:signal transduction histidine kinase
MDYSNKTNTELIDIIRTLEVENQTLSLKNKSLILEKERSKRESNENYMFLRTLIDSVPIALYYLDNDRVIIDCNPAFEELLHRNKSELIGKRITDIPGDDLLDIKALNGSEHIKEIFPKLITITNNNSNYKVIYDEYPLSDISDQYNGYVGLFFDTRQNGNIVIYDQREISKSSSERIPESFPIEKDLEKDTRLKDDFLAVISHELRTPLNAIIGMAEALEEGVFGDLNKTQAPPLSRIIESSKDLLGILNDVIQLSKISADKVHLNISRIDTEILLEKVLIDYSNIIKQKDLEVNIEIPDEIKDIYADERLLTRAVKNIIDNSIKFTSPKGKFGVRFSMDSDTDVLQICLWDTGIGIPNDRFKNIFQPFLQLDSGLKRQYGGLGLGLALVFRIIDLHGGSIYVKSIVSKGTSFFISLSLENRFLHSHDEAFIAQQYQNNKDFLALKYSNTGLPKILFVIRRNTELEKINSALKELGFNIFSANSIAVIMNNIRIERPQIAFIDIDLLDNEYKKTINEILAYRRISEIPIIVTSSLDLDDIKNKMFEAGVSDFIPKPLTIKKILKSLNTHLNK